LFAVHFPTKSNLFTLFAGFCLLIEVFKIRTQVSFLVVSTDGNA
jgi:hypothetical protein